MAKNTSSGGSSGGVALPPDAKVAALCEDGVFRDPPTGAVVSVNGQTGAVVLTAASVGADVAGAAPTSGSPLATAKGGTGASYATLAAALAAGGLIPGAASVGAAPAAPAATTSSSLVMAGLDQVITPVGSGKVLALIAGGIENNTASITNTVGARYGTGTPPVNGAAVTGTRWGGVADLPVRAAAAAVNVPFMFAQVITGLTLNTPCWLDLAFSAGSNTATITTTGVVLVELPS